MPEPVGSPTTPHPTKPGEPDDKEEADRGAGDDHGGKGRNPHAPRQTSPTEIGHACSQSQGRRFDPCTAHAPKLCLRRFLFSVRIRMRARGQQMGQRAARGLASAHQPTATDGERPFRAPNLIGPITSQATYPCASSGKRGLEAAAPRIWGVRYAARENCRPARVGRFET
jgi:hypothetical protein